jgi:hypothetical protein
MIISNVIAQEWTSCTYILQTRARKRESLKKNRPKYEWRAHGGWYSSTVMEDNRF